MTDVAIITGGAGGMGLATARLLAADHHVVLTDINAERLDAAKAELEGHGASVTVATSDILDGASLESTVSAAHQQGRVRAMVHTAGISPQMGGPELIARINTVGTINVAQAVLPVAEEGFSLVNVASVSAYMLPGLMIPTRAFRKGAADPEGLVKKIVGRAKLARGQESGLAYGISKAFVKWYSRDISEAFGAKGASVVSVSPGSFDTAMGRLEEKSGSANLLKVAALGRYGRPEEVAELLAFLASGTAAYITGTDILIDGGTMAGIEKHGRKAMSA